MRKRKTRTCAVGVVIAWLAGCASGPLPSQATSAQEPQALPPPATVTAPPSNQTVSVPVAAETDAPDEIVELGTGEYLATPSPAPEKTTTQEPKDVSLNFEATDLREFVRVIMEEIVKAPYVIDPKVTGKVTIHSETPVGRSDVLPLLDDLLAMNGAAVREVSGVYYVVPRTARGVAPPTTSTTGSGYATRIIPLRYLAAAEMQKILEPYLAEGANLRVDTKRNFVVASGTAAELDTLQETIELFDVDWLEGMSVGLFSIEHVEPRVMKQELDTIFGAMDTDGGGTLGGLVRTVPIERLNSLLVVSATRTALREVETWMHRLDHPGEHPGQRLYVYHVQNGMATELAALMRDILGGGASSSAGDTLLAPGLTPVEIRAGEPAAQPAHSEAPTTPSGGLALGTQAKVDLIADESRNALVVLATPQDYQMVESALRQLDTARLQVLIEASIVEVTLRDDLNYGVEWFFKNSLKNNGHDKEGRGQLDLGDVGLAALTPGFSYTVIDNADQVRLALNALAEESEVNVLSSPSLMVLDNETALINVGDEIPVPTRQSTSNIDPAAPTVNEIQFRQTGVTLTVTPHVNDSGLVTMDIKQEVSNAVSTTTSDIDAPTIQQRQIASVVSIHSGETIVLGGLIQNTQTTSESGLPVLHKIPVLGKLFGQTRDESRRTELLVLLTPKVARDKDGARKLTEEFKQRLKGLQPADPS